MPILISNLIAGHYIGPTGLQGIQGITGNQGIQGIGVQGFTGIQGIQGISVQGIQGSTGSQGVDGVQGPEGVSGALAPWILKNSNYTAISGNRIIADTTSGLFTITLPSSPTIGSHVVITDGNNFSINNVLIERNGSSIEGLNDNILLNIGGTTYEFLYSGTTWQVTANVGARGQEGIQGFTGIQGIQGISVQGIQGSTGSQGVQGVQGQQGTTGSQGTDGSQGTTGTGVQGIQGTTGTGTQGIQGANGGGGGSITISNKTSAYTVDISDLGTIIYCTSGTFTVSLTAAATLGSGFNCSIWNIGSGTITIDPAGSETIDGSSTLVLYQGEGTQIICNGTNWQTGNKKTMRSYAENTIAGTGANVASGTNSVAIGQINGVPSRSLGTYSAAFFGDAQSNSSTAIGLNSAGGRATTVTGSGAMALSGSYASGTDSFAVGSGTNSSSYGAKNSNAIALGRNALATGLWSVAIGYLATASASTSLALGSDSIASGGVSTAISGGNASAYRSTAIGRNAKADLIGKFAYSGEADFGASSIYSQLGQYVLLASTTNATPTIFTSNFTAASYNNQVILPNNSAYAFSALIVARQQAAGGTASAAWKVEGLIRREGSAGTTTLVNSATTVLDNTPGWTLAVSADTTNGGLAITATGAAATNIRWVATVNTSEVTYA